MKQTPLEVTKERILEIINTDKPSLSIVISSRTISDVRKQLELKLREAVKLLSPLFDGKQLDESGYLNALKKLDLDKEIKKMAGTKTLTLFVSKSKVTVFRASRYIKATPIVSVGQKSLIRYLIRDLNLNHKYYLLDLSQKSTNLYEMDRFNMECIDKKLGLPEGLQEVYDVQRNSARQQHRVGVGGAVFHGHAGGKNEQDLVTMNYLYEIDRIINERIPNKQIPIMLAGTENIIAKYRKISKYPIIWDSVIEGSIDKISESKILEMASIALSKQVGSDIGKLIQKLEDKLNLGKAATDFEGIYAAAVEGRIEKLIIKKGLSVWGKVSNGNLDISMSRQPVDDDLVNLLMCIVMQNGGEVFVDFENQLKTDLIAEFRY